MLRELLRVVFAFRIGLGSSVLLLSVCTAQAVEQLVVSVPGPRNLSYLPLDLMQKLGFDREENISLQLLHTGGGAVSLNHLITRNADFAVAGMPAAMSLRASGTHVVVIAAVSDAPLFVLMVRSALRDRIRSIADLKGAVIGVNTSTRSSKTTSQQLAELLLKSGGIALDEVRIVPSGQSWEEQSAVILSGAADAIVGDEPFASRLQAMGKVYFLTHLARPESVKNIPGAYFLHAALETRSDVIKDTPYKVEKMTRMLRHTLQWMANHTAEEIVDTLGVSDGNERKFLVLALKKYPRAFSRDGSISTLQLRETEKFFNASITDAAKQIQADDMVNDTWAGRKK